MKAGVPVVTTKDGQQRVDESALDDYPEESWSDAAAAREAEGALDARQSDFATPGEYSDDKHPVIGWAPVIVPIIGVGIVGSAYLIVLS